MADTMKARAQTLTKVPLTRLTPLGHVAEHQHAHTLRMLAGPLCHDLWQAFIPRALKTQATHDAKVRWPITRQEDK